MSSGAYAAPLLLELKPSSRLAVVLGVVHAGALALLWPLDLVWAVKLLLAALIAASFVLTLRRRALRLSPGSIVAIDWDSDSQWTLYRRNGEALAATLQSDSYLHPSVVVLNFRLVESRWRGESAVILRDVLPAQTFRQLRVRLRLEGGKTAAQEPY